MDNPLTGTVLAGSEAGEIPFDPTLPGTALLGEPVRLREVVSHGLVDWLGRGTRLFDTRVIVRHFFAGKRCSAELELVVGPVRGAPVERRRVLGKFYCDDHGARVHETLRDLRNHGFGAGRFLVPRPLGYDSAHRLLLLEWSQGESLRSRLIASRDVQESVEGAAAWLIRLHRCGVTSGRQYTPVRHVRTLTGWVEQLTEVFPEGDQLLADLLTGIRAKIDALPQWAAGPTHRDFSPEHVIAIGPRLVGLDLDEFCQYDPLFDVAHFTTQLRFLGLTRHGVPDHFDALADRFVAAYLAGGGEDSRERRSVYEAITWIKLCRFVALVRRPSDWRQIVPVLITQAQPLVR